jgi:hypothetical protein
MKLSNKNARQRQCLTLIDSIVCCLLCTEVVLLLQVIKAQSIAHVHQAPQHEHEHAMQLDT